MAMEYIENFIDFMCKNSIYAINLIFVALELN